MSNGATAGRGQPSDGETLITVMRAVAAAVSERRDYLTQLDAAIGDADHGINLDRGFAAALEKLEALNEPAPATVLQTVAMALIAEVGGASGPLYGTFFLRAASATEGADRLSPELVVAAFAAGVDGVRQRGGAAASDKTMLDALLPAREALNTARDAGDDRTTMLAVAARAAEQGMKKTRDMVARKGRASYLGERSRGHIDPGAASSHLMLAAVARAAAERC